jgi:hypothetical protein
MAYPPPPPPPIVVIVLLDEFQSAGTSHVVPLVRMMVLDTGA